MAEVYDFNDMEPESSSVGTGTEEFGEFISI